MMHSEFIAISRSADKFVIESLSQSRGLGKIAGSILKEGRIFSMVPEGTSRERAAKLNVGGLVSRRHGVYWLSEYICSMLTARPDLRFIAQDIWLSRGDVVNSEAKFFDIISVEESIYYVMKLGSHCFNAVEEIIRATNSAVFLGFLIRASSLELYLDDVLPNYSNIIEEFVMSAYDQESFIVWSRIGPYFNALQ